MGDVQVVHGEESVSVTLDGFATTLVGVKAIEGVQIIVPIAEWPKVAKMFAPPPRRKRPASKDGKWTWELSQDPELWSCADDRTCETRGEAILACVHALGDKKPDTIGTVGRMDVACTEWFPPDVEAFLEAMEETAYDRIGEAAECWADPSPASRLAVEEALKLATAIVLLDSRPRYQMSSTLTVRHPTDTARRRERPYHVCNVCGWDAPITHGVRCAHCGVVGRMRAVE